LSRRRLAWFALAIGLILASGCGREEVAPGAEVTGEVVVSAASSLTEAFTEIARAFEAQHPGTRVTLNFGSSAALATQINEASPVDVFASADRAQMDAVEAGRKAAPAVVFAQNRLVIAKPKGTKAVATYPDLARPGLKIVLAADGVPVGNYALQSLAAAERSGAFGTGFQARVLANVRSREANVRAVLAKVQLGEADAAIVYATDLAAAPEVEGVPIPDAYNISAGYLVAPLTGGRNAAAGRAFVAFVLGPEGQASLVGRGFTIPSR